MNIQLSVIVWTVICFLVLLVILDRLLFRPVLKILDERKERLAAARSKKKEYENLLLEREQERVRVLEERAKNENACLQQALDEIQAKEKIMLKDAHKECLTRIDAYREQREKELEEILTAVTPKTQQFAELFVQRLFPNKD